MILKGSGVAILYIDNEVQDIREYTKPLKEFEEDKVYLVCDLDNNIIWLKKGNNAPHMIKYKAASLAGKLNKENNMRFKIKHVDTDSEVEKIYKLLKMSPPKPTPKEKIEETRNVPAPSEKKIKTLAPPPKSATTKKLKTPAKQATSTKVKTLGPPPSKKTEPVKTSTTAMNVLSPPKKAKEEKASLGKKVDVGSIPSPRGATQAVSTSKTNDLKRKIEETSHEIGVTKVDLNSFLRVMAQQILYKQQVKKLAGVELPDKNELRQILYKEIDKLLDNLYSEK